MSGLLIKDFCLLGQRKRFFILLFVMALGLAFYTDGMFVVGYLTLIMAIFSISSISYDEYDNGYPFLMTLPFGRKTYVMEKYVFGWILGMGAWIAGCVVAAGSAFLNQERSLPAENFAEAIAYIPLFILILDFALPFQFKFGSERGRMALLVSAGVVALAGGVLVKVTEKMGVSFEGAAAAVSRMEGWEIAAIVAAATLLLTGLSYRISIGIMQKKEF